MILYSLFFCRCPAKPQLISLFRPVEEHRSFRELLVDPKNDTNALFLSKSGCEIGSSLVCLKSFARKTEVLPDNVLERFSPTAIRKATVTNTRNKTDKEKRELATPKAHSVSTANRHYSLENKIQLSCDGHKNVCTLYGSPNKKKEVQKEKTETKDEVKKEKTEAKDEVKKEKKGTGQEEAASTTNAKRAST